MALTHKYIAIGNPNPQGNGNTAATPYLVSTADEFDAIMHEIGVSTHIHLAAGTYFTYGQRYPVGYNRGWDVKSGWTISGAGEGATTIKLDSWPGNTIVYQPTGKWSVIGNSYAPTTLVSDVVIENLTVDGNWTGLANDLRLPTGWPDAAHTALHCVACYINGPITHRNLTITGFYGYAGSNSECFALSCHAVVPMDPNKNIFTQLAVFDHCRIHHGHGDYCVGIASFHPGPSIINGCRIYSLPGVFSKGIQAIGKDIQITNNIVWDCFIPFYVDTGNIINLLLEGNQFISNGISSILSNSTSQEVFIDFRPPDNANAASLDGVYMDVPIRRVTGFGAGDPLYRVRLWLSLDGSAVTRSAPPVGDLVKCTYPSTATIADLKAPGGPINEGLNKFFETSGERPFVAFGEYSGAALLSPVKIGSLVDLNTPGSGTHTANFGGTSCTFSANKTNNRLTKTDGTLPGDNVIVTVATTGTLPFPLGTPVPLSAAPREWVVQERNPTDSTFRLAWMHQIVVLTSPGAGNIRRIPSDKPLGTFRAITATSPLTLDNPPNPLLMNGELVAITGGGLPTPLVPDRAYVVRNVSGSSIFQLAWSEDHGEWIRHSAGAPFVSDESKVYIQSGWSWTNWKIRNNYLEVPFLDPGINLSYQSLISLSGNGSTDQDYHLADNVGRFAGVRAAGKKMYNLLMSGINRAALLDNTFEFRSDDGSGEVLIYKSESTAVSLLPIEVLQRFGNETQSGRPHRNLPDDFHQSGAGHTLASANGILLPGTIRFSNPASQGMIAATGLDFRNELRPGDLLATDSAGHIGTPQNGPFYVTSIDPDGLHATLSRPGPDSTTDYAVRRYRGPASYLTAAGAPLFHILNDGSLAVRGIPANLGFGESYLNASVTMTGRMLTGTGSVAAPAVSFASDTDTGIHRPISGALGFVTGGVERARVTSAGLQLGTHGLGFGPAANSPESFLVRDGAASTVALRNGSAAQAFRVYESSSSPTDYLRLSLTTQPAGGGTNYLIRTEAGGSSVNNLRSLQLGSGEKSGVNSSGLDTLLHAGQGTGSAMGGAIHFQVAPTGAVGLQTAWKIEPTGHLTAGDSEKRIRWGDSNTAAALKNDAASPSGAPSLEVCLGNDLPGVALLHRISIVAKTASYTILESDNGRCFTNAGASATVTFTLPNASDPANIGFHCWFVVESFVSYAMVIQPGSNNSIRIGSLTIPGANLLSNPGGVTIHLVCTHLHNWAALDHTGTWSID